jgi:hypothetical protein
MSFHIEEQIRDAQDAGHFDSLPGRGKPLSLPQNPFVHRDQLANDILQSNGFSLPWIEEKRVIEAKTDQAIQQLKRAWLRFDGGRESAYHWRQAKLAYRQAVDSINKRILTFNLKAPTPHVHLLFLDAEAGIRQTQEF